jgi:hypothetical protein
MTYFAKAQTALPFLMDRFEIPQDLFQLYIPTGLINGKFDSLMAAISLVAFSLISSPFTITKANGSDLKWT